MPACSAAGTATAVADVGAGAPGDSSGAPRDSGVDPTAPAVPAAAPQALQRISPARQAAATAAVRRFADKLAGRDADLAAPAERCGEPATGHDMRGAQLQPAMPVAQQVEALLRVATSADRLSRMYEGATPAPAADTPS